MNSLARYPGMLPSLTPETRRKLVIVSAVLLFHVAVLWAMQSGMLRKAVELVVPVHMLSEFIEPPAPKVVPLPAPPPPPATAKQPVPKSRAPSLPPTPQPLAVADDTPAPDARHVPATPPAPATPVAAPVQASDSASPASPTPAAPPRVELPSSDAAYLQNPRPIYPPMSKRMGEQGQVVCSVLIGTDGLPVSARLVKSSGFDRLDEATLHAVMRWRYTPGKRNGVPAAMSFNVPITWVLE